MPILPSREFCCGCSACHDACAHGAISMVPNSEGFRFPKIDVSKCVNCQVCVKVCPSLNRGEPRQPLAVYAAQALDDGIRLESSSGGLFTLLARDVLKSGGVVFGARFNPSTWMVEHVGAQTETELAELRGSKYVQSDTAGIYRAVKDELAKERSVLFVGTPCQIAALRKFLGHEDDRLLLVDVICHAVPSPLAWKKYLENRLAEAYSAGMGGQGEIRRIASRRKDCGWKRYSLSLRFANDKEYRKDLHEDLFLRGFLLELYNRPSCHKCQQRDLRSGSDLTIADYWRVADRFPEMDDDKGTSLVLVNTAKGQLAFEQIQTFLKVATSDFADAVRVNPSIRTSMAPHWNRSLFFRLCERMNFDANMERCFLLPLFVRFRKLADRILQRVGRL